VVQSKLQPPCRAVLGHRPAEPRRRDVLPVLVEDDDGQDAKPRVFAAGGEPDRAVLRHSRGQVDGVESPTPRTRTLPRADEQRLFDAVRAEDDRLATERQLTL